MGDDIIEEAEIPFESDYDGDDSIIDVDEGMISEIDKDELETDEENKKFIDHGKGFKRAIKVELNEEDVETTETS